MSNKGETWHYLRISVTLMDQLAAFEELYEICSHLPVAVRES